MTDNGAAAQQPLAVANMQAHLQALTHAMEQLSRQYNGARAQQARTLALNNALRQVLMNGNLAPEDGSANRAEDGGAAEGAVAEGKKTEPLAPGPSRHGHTCRRRRGQGGRSRHNANAPIEQKVLMNGNRAPKEGPAKLADEGAEMKEKEDGAAEGTVEEVNKTDRPATGSSRRGHTGHRRHGRGGRRCQSTNAPIEQKAP
uniref:Uncharacterized protein n=1 Tax=Pyrodinium bahamense TaxID=73915 RepID=A0A7S0FLJ7_9DINO|mmetsp:Transcript_37079/g.103170  ORF Transcript_37079/g.103170 Transcript_37079/m.103170 type:complete len:201 (+) Transcript_37079:120-722(+)